MTRFDGGLAVDSQKENICRLFLLFLPFPPATNLVGKGPAFIYCCYILNHDASLTNMWPT